MTCKRLLALLFALVLLTSIAGCSAGPDISGTGDSENSPPQAESGAAGMNETGLPIVNEPTALKLTSYHGTAHKEGFEGIEMVERWEQETGVTLEFSTVPQASWETHKTLIFSSGDIPDMIVGNAALTDSDVLGYADQGLIIPLQDLVAKYGENLNKITEENPNYRTRMFNSEGEMWSYPALADIDFGNRGNVLFVNKNWLADAGYDVQYEQGEYIDVIPDTFTTDDFYEMLKKFKELHPNSYHFELGSGADAFFDLYASFDAYDNADHLMLSGDTVEFTATNPNIKDGIKWANKLYGEGLIDPEIFTQDADTYLAKVAADEGETFGVVSAWTMQQFFDMSDDRFQDWALMLPLEGPAGTRSWPESVPAVINGFAVITSTSDKPEICARLIDYMYSDYNSVDLMIGPIGSAVTANDDGTYTQVPQPEGVTYDEWIGSKNPGCMPFICPPSLTSMCTYKDAVTMTIEVGQAYRPYQEQKNLPGMVLTVQDSQTVADFNANAMDFIKRKNAEWITNGGIDEEWDAYVQELQSMGVEEYVSIYQNTYDGIKEFLD